MISGTDRPPEVADQFAAHLIWMDAQPMLPERSYAGPFRRWVRGRPGNRPDPPRRCRHHGPLRRQDARAERDRLLQDLAGSPGAVRLLQRRPEDGRLPPHRQVDQRHRRRGHDRLRAAPGQQCRLAGLEDRQGGAVAGHRPETLRPLADRPLGSRQVDHRRPAGTEAASARQAHLCAGRRQTSGTD